MAAVKEMEKSPTYWEELMNLRDETLKDTFAQCAKISLSWAIDQAKCYAYNVAADSEEGRIVREFCGQAAAQALQEGDADAALTALQVAGDAAKVRAVLDQMVQTDSVHALGMAVLLKARGARDEAMTRQLAEFLINNVGRVKGGRENYGILLNVVRGDGEKLDAAQIGLLIARTQDLAQRNPYEASVIAREIIENCHALTGEQGKALLDFKDRLMDMPEVNLGVLEHEYGEDVTELRARLTAPAFVAPASARVH